MRKKSGFTIVEQAILLVPEFTGATGCIKGAEPKYPKKLYPAYCFIPSSLIGNAFTYSINLWDSLQAYLYDGRLLIDNNLIENSIRPNALGRKNYLFAGSHEGAKRSAMFYTFFGTCKMHGIDPQKWMNKVLEVIADHKVNKLYELFPQNLQINK